MCTIEGLTSTLPATAAQRKGKVYKPLLHIPLKNVVPDELHLMLHITDVLIRNLINTAMKYDAVNSRSPYGKKVCDRPVSDLLNLCNRAVTDL